MKIFKIDGSSNEQRLDRYIVKLYKSASKNSVQKWIRKKLIKVNGRAEKADYRLVEGDEVKVFLPDSLLIQAREDEEERLKQRAEKAYEKLDIAYEDEDILVVIKPQGLLVHPAEGEYGKDLSSFVKDYLYREESQTFSPASVSRLDFNTEGLVLFCKNYTALKHYNELMREGKIGKYYLALCEGRLAKKTLVEGYIRKDEENNIVHFSEKEEAESKYVKTELSPLRYFGPFTLVDVRLYTGRTHQIRASLSYLSHPIVGDVKYGARRRRTGNKQLLAAYKLVLPDREISYEPYSIRAFIDDWNSRQSDAKAKLKKVNKADHMKKEDIKPGKQRDIKQGNMRKR